MSAITPRKGLRQWHYLAFKFCQQCPILPMAVGLRPRRVCAQGTATSFGGGSNRSALRLCHESLTKSKAESHGCVRLTNWDAERVASGVAQGTVVAFVGGQH